MHRKSNRLPILLAAVTGAWASASPAFAANVALVLPLHRTAYQTNEWIDVSVVRSDAGALAAGNLTLTLAGHDASKLVFTFPVRAADVQKAEARATEHLHVNGRLLRPGKYTLEAACDGATARAEIEVYSHLRRSDFKLIDWGSPSKGKEQAVLGQDSMGFNLIYNTSLSPDDMIRGGADFMRNCTMSGAHQMDLRQECDWSDPYVLQGGEARVVAEALADRTMPNCLGVHFYDEPGLTWWKDPKNADLMVPFNIPAQDRSYRSAFGKEPPHWSDVKPGDAAGIAKWNEMNRWKMSFLEAAWKYAAFGVSRVRSDYLSAVQSEYGWQAYADGYYFNAVRPLPVMSGHGGYDDGPATYFYPSLFHEFGRIRDLNKPAWYLPTWYGESTDQFRLEQYLSFMTDLQGMAKPPDMKVHNPDSDRASVGIVESNKLMARLGPIFTTMRPTRPDVAILYSLSQDLGAEVEDMQDPKKINVAAYLGGDHVRARLLATYLAGKMIHVPFWPIVEEDITDGSLAAGQKAVILAGVNHLDAKVVTALEAYARGGGLVLLSDDCRVEVKGATRVGAAAPVELYHKMDEMWTTNQNESYRLRRVENWHKEVAPYAKALQAHLAGIGIKPPMDADSVGIVTGRQAQGDIEYLFAVNATPKPEDEKVQIQSATATLTAANDGRPVYDAIHGLADDSFKVQGDKIAVKLRFGPGEMRVFARTARPIGSVQVHPPVLFRDFTVTDSPVRIEAAASLLDNQHGVLSGSAPMQLRLIDPLGQVRYDLYRATDRGTLRIDLPLAANDPAGEWKLTVRELLSGTEGSASFTYKPGAQCAAAAGATQRAITFGDDRDNTFRLFRTHQDFTIVIGKGEGEAAAAERVAETLKPWSVRCKIVNAADVKVRPLSEEEAKTWAGLSAGRPDPKNLNAAATGFDLRGPAILIGTPEDNALIKFAADNHFLPYKTDGKDFPGRGRGFVSWQRDAVAYGQESVTLIAYDEAGLSEAVGSLYEAVAGIDPLTRLALPAPADITPAGTRTAAPEASIAWRAVVPDRVVSLKAAGAQVSVETADGSLTKLDASGKILSQESAAVVQPEKTVSAKAPAELAKVMIPDRVLKKLAAGNGLTALGYWGGTLQIVDGNSVTQSAQVLPSDIADMAWVEGKLIVGLADGSVVALQPK
ncbi:MAG: hypothetical protein JWO87_2097 [Phycisphaerales bacterium]|nr:hypothetical protein [Phycisphaerales bacterium]